MRLLDVLRGVEWRTISGSPEVEVTGIVHDSRLVTAGSLFVCLPGTAAHGRRYAVEAVRKGATAIMDTEPRDSVAGETVVGVPDTQKALAICCGNWYGNPARRLSIAGITGTNGKTTTSFFLESILRAAGRKTGLIGTIHNRIGDREIPAKMTTPGPGELHRLLALMVEEEISHSVMEVSSHGLAQDRVYGIEFAVGVFTNLSLEHMEYHRDMHEYLRIKAKLMAQSRISVANLDETGSYRQMAAAAAGRIITYGLRSPADVRGEWTQVEGTSVLSISFEGERIETLVALPGRFNAYNVVAASAAAVALGVPLPLIAEGVAHTKRIPGRHEEVSFGQPFKVVVDYAHTPDGLSQLLTALRQATSGRLILVFGARGGKDRRKRSLMGAIAAQMTDACFLTNDSPNDEKPDQILQDLERGYRDVKSTDYRVVPDRREAMRLAVESALPGDTIAVTGRGHEASYRVGDEVVQLYDADYLRECLRGRARQVEANV